MEENNYKVSFYDKISQLFPLYEGVKSAIILCENFDEERQMYIAPINQLRSALDHIFKSVNIANDNSSCDYELKEAKEHMERAGYDALELLAGSLGASIIEKLKVYDTDTLTTIFPKYYTEIKPTITEVKQIIATLRTERKTNAEKSFDAYFSEIRKMIDINKSVDIMIPSLQEYSGKKAQEEARKKEEEQKKNKKERLWQYLIGPVIGFVSATVIAIIAWLLTK
jgi:hypothetical protein